MPAGSRADTELADALREVAEYPNSFVALGPGDERIETDRFTLCLSAEGTGATVQRQRFGAGELDEVLAEIRALLRDRGHTRTQWEVGSRARPEGLVELLRRRGLRPDREPAATAMVLTSPPPPPPAGPSARAVETDQELISAVQIQLEVFQTPPEERALQVDAALRAWRAATRLTHGVWLEGHLVGAGVAAPTPRGLALFGGATLIPARGRGVYRALIGARWAEAQRLRRPALLTQAGPMSMPILERLGFVAVGGLRVLVDSLEG